MFPRRTVFHLTSTELSHFILSRQFSGIRLFPEVALEIDTSRFYQFCFEEAKIQNLHEMFSVQTPKSSAMANMATGMIL
jgi:hypothetical protein